MKEERLVIAGKARIILIVVVVNCRSDVVLMCFDVGRRSSLDNCREMWLPQIRRFCPNTPIILVGCKNDVRFLLHDQRYLTYCRERSPLVRQVREADLVSPSCGRAAAIEMGLPYYEASVLTYFGVNEVFESAIRAALCARRQQRFWIYGHLKRVSGPQLQVGNVIRWSLIFCYYSVGYP